MKKSTFTLMAGLLVILSISCTQSGSKDPLTLYSQIDRSAAQNTLTGVEKKNGWVILFDGKSTNGFHGYNLKTFPDCWIIQDGAFTTTTKGGS